ncbi:hypothetical protein AMTR_s00167p00047770 [Amborella trichopoda]|uniref:Uncharacterized protein n=1 Tax=Amborella trichopoda TaxID=13333 RepID=W1PS70_AMBTC|nr:hypothetical protein AMTR_s00167p00047770 [Amborella trichopoda]
MRELPVVVIEEERGGESVAGCRERWRTGTEMEKVWHAAGSCSWWKCRREEQGQRWVPPR